MAITLNNDANRSLGAPVSYTFMYIGNGSAFLGNKIVSIPFSEGELETLQCKPLETNVETFHLFRFQFSGTNRSLLSHMKIRAHPLLANRRLPQDY